MERILLQRDRLLAVSARMIGLTATAVSFVLLALPGGLPLGQLLVTLPLFAALAVAQFRMGTTRAVRWPFLVVGLGLGLVVLLRVQGAGLLDPLAGGPTTLTPGIADAMRLLAAVSVGSVAIMFTLSLGRMLVLVVAFAATMTVVAVVFANDPRIASFAAVSTLAGWVCLVAVGSVLSAGLLRAARRISNIGRAHRIERQASETEAQRRQGARLLHDTVLATLTLLAHSGVGVSSSALRRQAADDARLLRQLRLSAAPLAMNEGDAADTGDGRPGASALDAVKKKYRRLGLDVSWHGADTVTLGTRRLDAFLLALGECLENVRRHSGEMEAHVTITDDEAVVRALVTDNGRGFDTAAVPAGRLGYRESIVGRITEIGGSARVFSAAGAGTTVVLEVPR